jgi:hypothetical protein
VANLVQVLALMAVPVVILLTIRYVIVRQNRVQPSEPAALKTQP